jgi:hypothetical protein
MAKRYLTPNASGVKLFFYVPRQDGTGAMTGLTAGTPGLALSYLRAGATTTAPVPLVAIASNSTAHTPGGFREADAANLPGVYLVHLPDAAFASGADSVVFVLRGAALMAAVPIELLIGFPAVNVVQYNGESALAYDVPVVANVVQVDGATLADGKVPALIDASSPLPANVVQVAGAGLAGGAVPATIAGTVAANVVQVAGAGLAGGAVPASLVATGLDAIPTAETSGIADHTTLQGRINALYERFFGENRHTSAAFETLKGDGTVRTTQSISETSEDSWTMGAAQ